MYPVQCKMARAALGWGIRDLAKAAKVSADTVSRLERGEVLMERTLDALRLAFESAGIHFIEEEELGPGVRLQNPISTRNIVPR